jgi:prefoldin subunit 5
MSTDPRTEPVVGDLADPEVGARTAGRRAADEVEDVLPRAESTASRAPPASAAAAQREEFEALSTTVLDAAEVASQAALAASLAGRELKHTAGVLSDVSFRMNKRWIIAQGVLTGLLVLSIGFFAVMAARLISKTNQLDATFMAVGKRVVELDAGLTGLQAIQENMDALAERVTSLTKAQAELGQRVDNSVQQSTALVQQVPEQTARQVADTSSDLLKQVKALDARLQSQAAATQSQANAVRGLGAEVKALQGSLGEVSAVKRDVEALVTLQRERFLEALQKQGQTANDVAAVRFPRTQPPRTAAPSAGPVVNPLPAAADGVTTTPVR